MRPSVKQSAELQCPTSPNAPPLLPLAESTAAAGVAPPPHGRPSLPLQPPLALTPHSSGQAAGGQVAVLQPPPPRPQVFDDASSEIADIDTRLHALQNFLKMAKGSSAASSRAAA